MYYQKYLSAKYVHGMKKSFSTNLIMYAVIKTAGQFCFAKRHTDC